MPGTGRFGNTQSLDLTVLGCPSLSSRSTAAVSATVTMEANRFRVVLCPGLKARQFKEVNSNWPERSGGGGASNCSDGVKCSFYNVLRKLN